MEKQCIEQLLNNGFSLKKIKGIVEQAEITKEHNLNETTTANTCGLRTIKCGCCHRILFEDKFQLNKLNKRYRSCIYCIIRSRDKRCKAPMKDDKGNHDPIPATKILAICDTEPIKTVEDTYIYENIEPHTLLSSYDNIETKPITTKLKEKIVKPIKPRPTSQEEPEIEPQLCFYKLF